MRFAHISDLHLCQEPDKSMVVRDDVHSFVEALAHDIGGIGDILDFVVLSGDLTDDAHPESFRQVVRIFSALNLPVYLVPGNHDGPRAFLDYKRESGFLSDCDISGRVIDLGGIRLLGINTCLENEITGAVAPRALEALERELDSTAGSQLVIVMHHPPFLPGLREFDEISRLENGDRFAALLRGSNAAPIVLCGHVHRPYFSSWHGANCFVAGSPAAQFAGDLPFGDPPIRPSDEQYSYYIHSVDGPDQHVMTPRRVEPPHT